MRAVFFSTALAAASALSFDEVRDKEARAFFRDATTLGLPAAAEAFSVRKAERLREGLASGRLAAGPVAHTTYGDVIGVSSGNVSQWLGVPFAAPPVGALRWRPPTPPEPWASPRDATWFGPTCPQTEANTWAIFTGTSEDCLNLNVYAPAAPPPPGGYPVMLFWYGGSFTYGSAGFPLYDGFFEVSLLKDTIIVAANYRLGVLGFLAGEDLKAESTDGSVGTYGSMDQRFALEFLRDNAAAFGGDPTRVTIFGQSAGAASVSQMLVNPRASGLFSRAIIESGSFSAWTAQPYNISKTRLPQFSKNVGCAGNGAALLACLRAVNVSEVLRGDKRLTSGFLEWSPTIDGVEILDDPRVLLAQGKAADVPVMLGFVKDEGTMFAKAPKDLNASEYVAAIATILPYDQAVKVAQVYPCSDFKPDLGQSACWWGVCEVERDAMFACPVQTAAGALAAAPRANGGKVFAYLYTHVLFIVDIVDLFKPYRCFHGSELPLVFDLWPAMFGEGEAALATWVAEAWTSFAATGDPNHAGAPAPWPPFRNANETLLFDTGAGGVNLTAAPNLLADKCAFWSQNPISEEVIWG